MFLLSTRCNPVKHVRRWCLGWTGYGDVCQRSATAESIVTDCGYAVWDSNRGQRSATAESIVTDCGYAVWDSNRGQRGAIAKSTHTDGSYAVWDSNRGQRGATVEGIRTDGCDAVRDNNTSQYAAPGKGAASNPRDTVWEGDRGQRCAIVESICPNHSYVVMRIDLGYIQLTNPTMDDKLAQFVVNHLFLTVVSRWSDYAARPYELRGDGIKQHHVLARFVHF